MSQKPIEFYCPHCQGSLELGTYFIYTIKTCDQCGWSYCLDTKEWYDENGKTINIKEVLK